MDFHRTPYLGPLIDAAVLPDNQEKPPGSASESVDPIASSPAAARKAGEHVSGRILSVTTNFPQVPVLHSEPSMRTRRGQSGLNAMLEYLDKQTEWENMVIAWIGEIEGLDDEHDENLTQEQKDQFAKLLGPKNAPVWLDGPAWRWREYAEKVLWPTLHYSHNINDLSVEQAANYSTYGWNNYQELNERFAEVVLANYKEGDIIMIHDMYLFLLPSLLRAKLPDALIGLYVHSSFPSSELFRGLPQRSELLTGMLGSTVIGFQSTLYIKHFKSAVMRVMGLESAGSKVLYDGRYVACLSLPFGVDVKHVLQRGESPEVRSIRKEISELYVGKKIIVGRDKLDNTQGIIEKLRAYLALLELYPQWRGEVVFVQITTMTWQFSPWLEQQVSQLISYINGTYGDMHYAPIVHFSRHMEQDEYFALLQTADVGFFTPIREGASSAAVEYVLCQNSRQDRASSMVLSEFMGITDLLLQGGIAINPFDQIQVAYALNKALLEGNSGRNALQEDRLYTTAESHYDVETFAIQFLSSLVLHDLRHENQHYTPDADVPEIENSAKKAKRRLLLLDYDGTLTPIVRDPAAAVPSDRLKEIFRKLGEDPNTTVWVISGRDKKFMDQHLAPFKLNLSAEHGCYVKTADESPDGPWEDLVSKLDMSWMKVVLDVLQSYTERTEGSNIEQKQSAITWHYRRSDPEFGAFQASHLRAYLELTVANKYPIDVMAGKANVEIRPSLFNKGEIVRSVFQKAREANEFPEFVLCMGDDTTDEDMFRVVRDETDRQGLYPIMVGPQNRLTLAKYHVNTVNNVHDLLEAVANHSN